MASDMSNKQAKYIRRLEAFRGRFLTLAMLAEPLVGMGPINAADADFERSKHAFALVKAVAARPIPAAADPAYTTTGLPCLPGRHVYECLQVIGECINRPGAKREDAVTHPPMQSLMGKTVIRRMIEHTEVCLARESAICVCQDDIQESRQRDPVAEYSGSVFKPAMQPEVSADVPEVVSDEEQSTEIGMHMFGWLRNAGWLGRGES